MPEAADERNALRSYTVAGAGLTDEPTGGQRWTLDFLPGGAPGPGQRDRTGNVVASRWGAPPYRLLTEGVSLRAAWDAITAAWPSTLADAADALQPLTRRRAAGADVRDEDDARLVPLRRRHRGINLLGKYSFLLPADLADGLRPPNDPGTAPAGGGDDEQGAV
ncbi:hypothetical protein CU254_25980 [Amycolatopsis sp. AA4]|uniref:hypothetical protein n=1 Tax=Actinomycetes TaxID=1760 RepID=UPI0001B545E9|nr:MULTISPECIES: hypothetical protein [Actinomycetes]ATY13492.1 hypothetical protein CU254_25980 [Amycolatopsis sp. AA4]